MERAEDVQLGKVYLGVSQGTEFRCIDFVVDYPNLANYGIGGQYEPHYDHATENDVGDFGEEDGNRIATWLSYMSEPRYGGGTIFMEPVGIRAEPVKVSSKIAVW